MSEKHTVAMFVQNDNGEKIQVGWASPKNDTGIRTFEMSPGFEDVRPRDVSFEDDELSQEVAEEKFLAREGDGTDGDEFEVEVDPEEDDVVDPDATDWNAPLPAEPVVEAPNEEQAAEPIEEAPDAVEADETTEFQPSEDSEDNTDDSVELNTGGEIVDNGFDEDEEAEFQRLLAEEETTNNQPQTRRELRENEENTND